VRMRLRIFCASSIGRSWVDRKTKSSARAAPPISSPAMMNHADRCRTSPLPAPFFVTRLILNILEIGNYDFFGHRVEHRAAQLPAVAVVARLAGGARVDDEHVADASHQLMVRMAV